MKKFCLFLLAILLIAMGISAHAGSLSYSLGDTVEDFSFTTYDGQEMTLSQVLEEKEAVLLNIWATWCSPCRSEFPYMQQAYEKYQDKVEVIALSCEPTDTNDVLASFASEYGLTFKIGQDPVGFLEALGIGSIPTTLMIDRFGAICLIETGAQPNQEAFERMFDAFIGDDYTESVVYRSLPSAKPNVPASTEAELAAALEVPAVNPENAYIWPMVAAEKDGRTVLTSSNAGYLSSEAAVIATVEAKAGNAIVVTFKTSVESVFDVLKIHVNGQVSKVFSGEHDWMDYAIPVTSDGEYVVKISYTKDTQGDAGEDTVWIDRIAVVEDGASAVGNNPVYPVAEELSIQVVGDGAKEILMEDATGLLKANFGDAKYYIANADRATVLAAMPAEYDPEEAFLYAGGVVYPLMSCMQDNGYAVQINVDSAQTTGYACSSAALYTDNTGANYQVVVVFRDEENVNLLCEYNGLGTWAYADNTTAEMTAELTAQVEYIFKCVDQEGNPVSGVMLQVCDETTCQVLVSDANGVCQYVAAPYAWEVHVLMATSGYSAGDQETVHTPVEGGELTFTLTKE